MQQEKRYIEANIKTHTFQNGGTILKVGIKADSLRDAVKNGWVNIIIAKRQQPSEKGATHYAYIDDFEPKRQDSNQEQPTSNAQTMATARDNAIAQNKEVSHEVEGSRDHPQSEPESEIRVEDIPF